MSQTKVPVFNPFQVSEFFIDQSLKALQNGVKLAEQNEKMALQMLDIQRKNREEGVKMIESAADQLKQTTRLFIDLFEKTVNSQVQTYRQASKSTVEEFSKQVAQFSKS